MHEFACWTKTENYELNKIDPPPSCFLKKLHVCFCQSSNNLQFKSRLNNNLEWIQTPCRFIIHLLQFLVYSQLCVIKPVTNVFSSCLRCCAHPAFLYSKKSHNVLIAKSLSRYPVQNRVTNLKYSMSSRWLQLNHKEASLKKSLKHTAE